MGRGAEVISLYFFCNIALYKERGCLKMKDSLFLFLFFMIIRIYT
ncbi:hypothetical protein BFO_2516 [Tannerella forsythia 92A2]|uniref:Uncharacterized protein n=2 Tax=Tannerella forsythia TaxID=28112 RepID=G8UKS8_TANFA|nr:hypothetical protein BFO_2516 [Tannerella forsythia 92A2]SCQ23443.1 hypothetical protein TFUB20_02048 [Tannerella forsythia]